MPGVRGNWFAELTIDGQAVPITADILTEMTVRSSIHTMLPSLTLGILDPNGRIFDAHPIYDGVPISVTMGDGNGPTQSMNFVAQGGPQNLKSYNGGLIFSVAGLLDNMAFRRKMLEEPIKGTSMDVLKKLASMSGLSFDGHSTSDAMTWLPNRLPLADYARFATEHGFAGGSSCMMTAVTEGAKLLYRDLDRIVGGGVDTVFSMVNTGVPVVQVQGNSKAGMYNNQRAYGSTLVTEGLDGVIKELKDVTASRLGEFINVGSNVFESINGVGSALKALQSGDIGAVISSISDIGSDLSNLASAVPTSVGGRLDVMPISGGNTHPKWAEAEHQNRRLRTMFSEDLHVLAIAQSAAELLTKAQFDPPTMANAGPRLLAYAGEYIITNKVMTIRNGRYYEKVTLTGSGNGGGM